MMRLTDVVKNLLIINVVVYVMVSMLMPNLREYFVLFYPGNSEYFHPIQLVTHMFMHGSPTHLFFNMFALYMFGPPLENYFGAKKFLIFYLLSGFGAVALHMAVWYFELSGLTVGTQAYYNIFMGSVVGASGAVFGLLAGFGTLFPDTKLMLLFPPIPIKAKWFVLIYGAIELFLGVSNFNTGIAHFAHLGGAIFGFLLIQYWRKNGNLFNR